MKHLKIMCTLLALMMLLSVAAYASPPTEFDGVCPTCGGGSEAIGTKDWTLTKITTTPCQHSSGDYVDTIQWADVQVQFECWSCQDHYTQTISIPYTITCGYTGVTSFTAEANHYGLAY